MAFTPFSAVMNSTGCPATGDDTNTPFVVDHFTGTSYAGASSTPGKGFGFADWLWP